MKPCLSVSSAFEFFGRLQEHDLMSALDIATVGATTVASLDSDLIPVKWRPLFVRPWRLFTAIA